MPVGYGQHRVCSPGLRPEQDSAAALADIERLQYDAGDASGCLWVADDSLVPLANAGRPDLADTDVSGVADSNGQLVFQDMVRIALADGEGYYAPPLTAWPGHDISRKRKP